MLHFLWTRDDSHNTHERRQRKKKLEITLNFIKNLIHTPEPRRSRYVSPVALERQTISIYLERTMPYLRCPCYFYHLLCFCVCVCGVFINNMDPCEPYDREKEKRDIITDLEALKWKSMALIIGDYFYFYI